MKVKITHTVDLDSVAERSKELILPAIKDIQDALSSLEALNYLLSGGEAELNLAVQHMDLSRKKLGSADATLGECHAMLTGVNDYNLEQAEKRLMEEKLEQQEQEYQEQLLQQQQAAAQAEQQQPAGEDAAPPVHKRWDPVTKSTTIIEESE